MVGQTLGHYKILELLGKGGMGEVYRAEDITLKRDVALKVLPQELSGSQERLERFQREAETLAALNHPNIVHIYTVQQAEGTHFLTMQLVEGKEIDARSDILSLGVVLYEMATGERPFQGDSSASLITAIMSHSPREVDSLRTNLSHHLSRIIRHCLEKEPIRRYQSAVDVRNELEDLRREETSQVPHRLPPLGNLIAAHDPTARKSNFLPNYLLITSLLYEICSPE